MTKNLVTQRKIQWLKNEYGSKMHDGHPQKQRNEKAQTNVENTMWIVKK